MTRQSPFRIELTIADRRALETIARSYTLPYGQVIRARIILHAADGLRNDEIARRLATPRQVVTKWRKRFFTQGLGGLEEQAGRGRPPGRAKRDPRDPDVRR